MREIKQALNFAIILENQEYLQQAENMVLHLESRIKEHAAFYYNWFDLYAMHGAKFLEIAIAGKEWLKKLKPLSSIFVPYALTLGGELENLALLKGKLEYS